MEDLAYSSDMENICRPYAGKKITVMGLGVLGRGVGDVEFFASCGAEVLVTDKKSEEELSESIKRLQFYPNITYHLGGHQEDDFIGRDMIIKAAGVPLGSPYIDEAHKHGVPVYMSTALFARAAMEMGATVVGITGTRGKSTVTRLIYETLKKAGKEVLLGGNIRGVSTIAQLPQVTPNTIAVLELDSWQLQGFGDLGISPQVAVFTNLLADHQNYYKDEKDYFNDKANIFAFQKSGDTLICGTEIESRILSEQPTVTPLVPPQIPDDWTLNLPGEHNRDNAALAAAALRALGFSEGHIRGGLESCESLEGRLQFVREVRGIKIYNDNNATTPDATMAALKALDTGTKNIVLIMGGADKGLDASMLLYEIAQTTKRVILLTGTGTDLITPFIQDYSIYDNLKDAVDEALRSAATGDIVLFSPAHSSFGMFTNEYERNDHFLQIVRNVI
jgi:UDP-N-acetylmuramoylalanine--D-glutamate ligase